jgi:MFS family permease
MMLGSADGNNGERMALLSNELDKDAVEHAEVPPADLGATESARWQGDRALAIIGDERVWLTDEDNKTIRRKTDLRILPILVWVYFLQGALLSTYGIGTAIDLIPVIDKTTLGYGAVFGLQEDANLTGNQYSLVGSIAPIAQLVWQPFSSFLIVKVPHRILMPVFVLGWGIAQAAMGACHNYGGLMATRFLLGLFEAGCLPLFSIITSHWYRRAEQPLRVAAWYSMNGIANLTVAALSYGLGQIQSSTMYSWQM